MARVNTKTRVDHRLNRDEHLAGGFGPSAAKQDTEGLLRRAVLANLLWENVHYQDGQLITDQICNLVPQVAPKAVAAIAREARIEQRLRHVPLLLARECARHASHRHVVADLLPQIIRRPDELSEFMAIYWQDGKQPLANSVKKGLAAAFTRFDAYQLGKWNQDRDVKLRDVMFMVHPEPRDDDQAEIWRQLIEGELATPDTWEVALSGGADKKLTWQHLIEDQKLGALAFMRNLRNMEEAGVSSKIIRQGFASLNTEWLLPLNFFAAARHAPRWQAEIEQAMFRSLEQAPRLSGHTHLVVDVSGSMWYSAISSKSEFKRLDAAAAMAVLAREMCESVTIWATAGYDMARRHKTEMIRPHRGFALVDEIIGSVPGLGGGGIFTRQCLQYIKGQTDDHGDRTIIFSDSQDCDFDNPVPKPFSPRNYIVDISAHTHGVNYQGVWDAEVSGWSEHFLQYIAALESQEN